MAGQYADQYCVRFVNRAWPYDYPERQQQVTASDAAQARQVILTQDPFAEVLEVTHQEGTCCGSS